MKQKQLIVIPVEFYQTPDGLAWCESAFALHLKELRNRVYGQHSILHIVGTRMSDSKFEDTRRSLLPLDEHLDKIIVTLRHPSDTGRLAYIFRWIIPNTLALRKIIKDEDVAVHSGPSSNPLLLFEYIAILFAVRFKRPCEFLVDIDERESAHMDYKTGALSTKSYILRKYFYDPFFSSQISYAVKHCSLVLLKGGKLKHDYGAGKEHVKDFLDAAFNEDILITDSELHKKTDSFVSGIIKLVYFGRLVRYKGLLDMIKSVVLSRKQYNTSVELTIIGDGDQKRTIEYMINELDAESYVFVKDAVTYGPELFDEIDRHDALLATPQREDTPRNALDAMARGLGIIAYDTYYYRDLSTSNAVLLSPWNDIPELARTINDFALDSDTRRRVARSALLFAKNNTQDIWLDKRKNWIRDFLKVE